jgi:NitT/TauT family transport system substrate-binding protein
VALRCRPRCGQYRHYQCRPRRPCPRDTTPSRHFQVDDLAENSRARCRRWVWEKTLGKGDVGHLLWADFGLPIYGHTYFVNNDLIRKNPKIIERFLRATHKGWKDAKANPAASIDAMVEAVPGLDRSTLLATMPQILDLCVTERSAKHGLGWIEPELMKKTMDITFASNKPDKAFAAADAFTNQFSSKVLP